MSILYYFFGQILYYLDSFIHNYGLTIIVFTILVKLVLLPLNLKSTQSMRETQKLSKVTQYFQKKYKNNPEKLNSITAQLYQIYHINPLGGCWPMLVQLPIIYALFGALRNPAQYVFTHGDISATSQSFLWIPNLSNPDPYYILPILCVIFTYLTQKFTNKMAPATGDESAQGTQNWMLYFMPLLIGFFAMSLPAGIGIYWVVQNIFTFVQQFFSLRRPVEYISIEDAEKKLKEFTKEKKDQIKVTREMSSQKRREAMGIKEDSKSEKKKPSVKTKTASSGKKRKTITKIPDRK